MSGSGRVLRAVRAVCGLVLLYVLVLAALPDQALVPAAAECLKPKPTTLPATDNAFYLTLGFDAAAEDSPQALGEQIARDYSTWLAGLTPELLAESWPQAPFPFEKYDAARRIDVTPLKSLCEPEETPCLGSYHDAAIAIRDGERRFDALLERYDELRRKTGYEDPLPVSLWIPIPSYGGIGAAQRLVLAGATLEILEGHGESGAARVFEDLAFQRRQLAQAPNLIAKMVAVRQLARTLHTISQVLDLPDGWRIVASHLGSLEALSNEEADMRAVMCHEFRFTAAALDPQWMRADPDLRWFARNRWVEHFVFKRNATLNRLFEYEHALGEAMWRDPAAPQRARWRMIFELPYNPLGTILGGLAPLDFAKYGARVRDVAGLVELLRLEYEVRRQGVTANAMAGFVSAYMRERADAFVHGPVQWNAGAQTIEFPGHDDRTWMHSLAVPEKLPEIGKRRRSD